MPTSQPYDLPFPRARMVLTGSSLLAAAALIALSTQSGIDGRETPHTENELLVLWSVVGVMASGLGILGLWCLMRQKHVRINRATRELELWTTNFLWARRRALPADGKGRVEVDSVEQDSADLTYTFTVWPIVYRHRGAELELHRFRKQALSREWRDRVMQLLKSSLRQ
ncbi:hypothetical protein Poly30_52290 [Planctomycetes bacterium Poly30]|uniref:Uncharacterized protein n=1 Tax=Saltatorellus ferox TaxID=2528018 RepID=A0A518F021_9BACT|nr:hypothetical protein Poly30_52290 [Planctomycetes bacterium Poly30]